MEAKLKEYRALRNRREFINNTKEKLEESKKKIANFLVPKFFREMRKEKEEEVLLVSTVKYIMFSSACVKPHDIFHILYL